MFRVVIGAVAILGVMTLSAAAFEQTTEIPEATSEAPAAAGTSAPSVELIVPEASTTKKTGPTVSIPGIGKIGTLPKFDFGLELLYGEDDTPAVVEDDAGETDLRIRGSVKHKF